MKDLFNEAIPFSDYVILYFVNMFGVDWLNFYHLILLILFSITIGGWILAWRIHSKFEDFVSKAKEEGYEI